MLLFKYLYVVNKSYINAVPTYFISTRVVVEILVRSLLQKATKQQNDRLYLRYSSTLQVHDNTDHADHLNDVWVLIMLRKVLLMTMSQYLLSIHISYP